jgi:cell wall-associated NlpC family hydrolase
VVALAAGVALALVGMAPVAADEPSATTAPPTTAEATVPTVAPTTTPDTTTPGSTVAPPVSGPGGPTSTKRGATTTTKPGATTTTVPDDGVHDFAATPAPLIPAAASDPLFHAALTVDDDIRNVAIAKADALRALARSRTAARTAASAATTYRRADGVDRRAIAELERLRASLRAAAMHAYTGYGSQETVLDSPEVARAETVLPYRTYVEVTITEATARVAAADKARSRTKVAADAARAKHRSAAAASAAAAAAQRTAAADLKADEQKLKEDRKALDDLIASMPDLAPGTLEKLPKVTKLPPGAQVVASPAGDIVVPAKADPRTAVALQFIVAQLGKPYVWGATGPNSYDCSGLMLRAFQAAGVTSMPRVSQGQQVWATPIEPKDVQPGDLVFFGRPAYHVGVYIGGGLMMDAPFTGAYVRVDKVWASVTSYGRPVWTTPAP